MIIILIYLESGEFLCRQHFSDGCREGGLAVVDVTDGPDVEVRLVPLEVLLAECSRHGEGLAD